MVLKKPRAEVNVALLDVAAFEMLAGDLDHPEGVACGPDGCVYAGGEAGQIYRISIAERTTTQVASTAGTARGIALTGNGDLLVCDPARHQVLRINPHGTVAGRSAGASERPLWAPNYPVFDAAGNLYVSDSGHPRRNDGLVFRIRPDGLTAVFVTDAREYPNGLALSADGCYLYVVLSSLPGVVRYRLNVDGTAGAREVLVEMPHTVPDGLAFDAVGNLYVSCYQPDAIFRLSPDGRLQLLTYDPHGTILAAPTNTAFAGPNLQFLVVANFASCHLSWARLPVGGQPLHYPHLPAWH